MRRPARIALLLAGCLSGAAAPGPAVAQEADGSPDPRLLAEVRSQQQRFERVRRNHLPWTRARGGGSCDERIGRFCLSHGSGDIDWEPEPEHPRVAAARDELLAALGAAAAEFPGSGWVAGQRVRYLVEAGRHEDAVRAARDCRAAAWWCGALTGFALHYAGLPAAADSSFGSALDRMPEAERRRWTDLSPLLDDCAIRHYRRLPEPARPAFEERFWRLADPFAALPGNETRSEHLARHVWDGLQDRAASTEGLSWADDLREILLRYGWPRGWERVRPDRGLGPASMVSHYAGSDRDLLPPCEVLRDEDLTAGEWDLEPAQPRTGYAIPMPDSAIEWVGGVEFQVATFRRGDSARVVAAYEIPTDSVRADAAVEAAVALLTPGLDDAGIAPFPRGGHSDAVAVPAPQGPLLLSIEMIAREARRAARVRYGIGVARAAPGLIGISDLLLLRSAEPLPGSLDDAVPVARRSTRVAPGERVGVYWEIYGLTATDGRDLALALRIVEVEGGWIRGVGRAIGLVDDTPPVLVRWREAPGAREVFPRSVAVTIPPEIRAGRYALELTVTAAGREPLTIRRLISVAGP